MELNIVNRGQKINLADLSDTHFIFNCQQEIDDREYFDYNLSALFNDYEYNRSMSREDIIYLRENCKRILAATEVAL